MRIQSIKFFAPMAMLVMASGCMENSLGLENPNQLRQETFWQTEGDAIAGMNAVYRRLMENGTWARNRYWAMDHRTDTHLSRSPAGNIINFGRSTVTNLGDGFLEGMWVDPYRGIFNANQAITNIPDIDMNETLKKRLIAEARFLRAYFHYEQALIFGPVPIITELPLPGDTPEYSTQTEVYDFAIAEAKLAAQDLPWKYTGSDVGRVTKGAALMLVAETQLNQKKWADAAATLRQIVNSGEYSLMPNYADLFTLDGENSVESIFEVQFAPNSLSSQGVRGNQNPRLVAPSTGAAGQTSVGFNDTQPTKWHFEQFFNGPGRSYPNNPDPRLDATIFWNKPGGMDVFGSPFTVRYRNTGPGGRGGFKGEEIDNTYFIKKYQEYWKTGYSTFDNEINYKVYRYGMTLMYLAEALTETGDLNGARAALNQLRARVGLPNVPVALTATQQQMRDFVDIEFTLELSWEQKRYAYLMRHGKYNKAVLTPRNPFLGDFFVDGRSELMPKPQSEVDTNPNVVQNPGW